MGGGDYVTKRRNIYTRQQAVRLGLIGDTSRTTRTTIGGYEKITYKEIVNGVTIIRTRWRKKKTKEKYRRT